MKSQTFERMEKALTQFPAKPWEEVVAELKKIADDDPDNPAPHLMMALGAAMGDRSIDPQGVERHLEDADRLLQAGRRTDPEWELSENLFKALKSDYDLERLRRVPEQEIGEAEIEAIVKAQTEYRRAVAQIGRLRRRMRGLRWPNVLYAHLLVLSETSTSTPGSADYERGMASLSRAVGGGGPCSDAAGVLQLFAYRKAHKYTQAIRVGRRLEQRNPGSASPKRLLGVVYYSAQRLAEAQKYYEEAISLAPNEPSDHLAHAAILERAGDLRRANEALKRARSLDKRGQMTQVIEKMETSIRTKERSR